MLWDIFCKVIDNFGDIGVCWRLSADLAARGEQVRLWVDDPSALAWMAPQGCAGVSVLTWRTPMCTEDLKDLPPSQVWVEAFGCEIAPEFVAFFATPQGAEAEKATKPAWINLEYLSAESYVERCHALPSPILRGPAAGWTKWFFYPGFTAHTGGLLREPDLLQRQAAFDRQAWLAELWPQCRPDSAPAPDNAQLVSLFCYEPPALLELLWQLDCGALPTHLLVTAGRASHAVHQALSSQKWLERPLHMRGQLSISYLPRLTQRDFDHLLWACDLNFVRGEDSLVRALWAGKPFVWHIYPQPEDDAHHAKLEAFLATVQAPESLRQWHRVWNDATPGAPLPGLVQNQASWAPAATKARAEALPLTDLTGQLIHFVQEKR
ncbi:elongation factor P maturation arginine rhamnosyltransferase EarP [Variovorax sp. HJSM1_2]|uniref:elongation factor P maturation arginine rhamnosyltransferase EarP n=1 Tax=Variovorax sp. HJSM1_2 TaxID=3366263 RepID=UPI003BE8F430